MSKPKAPPIPSEPDDRAGWDRRFAWLVSSELARDARLTPEGAGPNARAALRREFETALPGESMPEWLAVVK